MANFESSCFIKVLTLEIFDHDFYRSYGGDPFTDISSILARITWPRLTCLQLGDVVIDKQVITQFLNRHPTLQSVAAYLSVSVDRATQNFELDMTGLKKDALPNLTGLAVHPKLVRPILCGVPDHSTIRELTAVEPRDWDAPEVEIESPGADCDTWSELPLANALRVLLKEESLLIIQQPPRKKKKKSITIAVVGTSHLILSDPASLQVLLYYAFCCTNLILDWKLRKFEDNNTILVYLPIGYALSIFILRHHWQNSR